MPCNLATQKKRIQWGKEGGGLAPCECQKGFQFDGNMSNEYWISFDTVQSNPLWTWLDAGFKVRNQSHFTLGTCEFGYLDLVGGHFAWISMFGQNIPIPEPGFGPATFKIILNVMNTLTFPPNPVQWERAESVWLWPKNNFDPTMGAWFQVFPLFGFPPTVIGTATATPLKCGNTC